MESQPTMTEANKEPKPDCNSAADTQAHENGTKQLTSIGDDEYDDVIPELPQYELERLSKLRAYAKFPSEDGKRSEYWLTRPRFNTYRSKTRLKRHRCFYILLGFIYVHAKETLLGCHWSPVSILNFIKFHVIPFARETFHKNKGKSDIYYFAEGDETNQTSSNFGEDAMHLWLSDQLSATCLHKVHPPF